MKAQQILKRLKPSLWLLVPVVGAIGAGLLLTRSGQLYSDAASVGGSSAGVDSSASSDSSVKPPASVDAAKTAPAPASPSASAAPTAQSPSATASQPAALTPEQEALNRQNTEEFLASLPSVDSLIEMRVAIAEGVPSATIRTSTEAMLANQDGAPLQTLTTGETYSVQPSGDSIRLNSAQLPAVVMIDPSPQGLFYLNDRAYRGRLLLIAEGGNLWAVNFVDMRSYLYSVVGSEVSPSWDMEALKAQAIAARSYGLTYHFRPAHSAYDLGATQRYQVYRGIEREADTIRQAVDATAGEFVSYRGGIVESLYAASDDIVMEVFQGRGMSQLGALSLANQGYSYEQILSNYYPDTGIGRIEQEFE